jgi:hypothetical protein
MQSLFSPLEQRVGKQAGLEPPLSREQLQPAQLLGHWVLLKGEQWGLQELQEQLELPRVHAVPWCRLRSRMGLAQMVELQGETLEGSWGLGQLAGEVLKVDDGTRWWGRGGGPR